MRIRGCLCTALVAALAVPALASADTTLGTVTQPSGSTAEACPNSSPNQVLISGTESDNTLTGPYAVPSSTAPEVLTQWDVNAAGASSGTQVTLVVLRYNIAEDAFAIIGADSETLNATGLPASNVETFTLSSPIPVQGGDLIGLYLGATTQGLTCYWSGGSITSDQVDDYGVAGPPSAGEQTTPVGNGGFTDSLLNIGATIVPLSYDAAVSLSSDPSNAVVGQPAILSATVTNNGPLSGPITFTDHQPTGLTIQSASIGSGTCAVLTATITCTTDTLAAGQSTKVVMVVAPTAAQSYTDSGTVSLPAGTDPNSANNSASTTLKVSAVAVPKCVVPKLGGASESLAKKLLPLLDCKVGKVKTTTSKSVAKGDVISTSPGAGSYAAGRSIGITISSGKPKPKKKKKKKN
jgi:uncharacterized repeat protein (TIGR01451 family)